MMYTENKKVETEIMNINPLYMWKWIKIITIDEITHELMSKSIMTEKIVAISV